MNNTHTIENALKLLLIQISIIQNTTHNENNIDNTDYGTPGSLFSDGHRNNRGCELTAREATRDEHTGHEPHGVRRARLRFGTGDTADDAADDAAADDAAGADADAGDADEAAAAADADGGDADEAAADALGEK